MAEKEKMVCSLVDKCAFNCFHKKPHGCNASCSMPCQRGGETDGATCEPVKEEKQVVCDKAENCTSICHHRTPHTHNSRCDDTCWVSKGRCTPVPENKIPYEATSTESVTVKKEEPQLYICDKHETCGSATCEHKFHHTHIPQCNVSGCLHDGDCKCVPYTPPAQIYAHLPTRLQAIEQQLDKVLKQHQNPQIRVTGEAAEQLHTRLLQIVDINGFSVSSCVKRIEQVLCEHGFYILPNEEE